MLDEEARGDDDDTKPAARDALLDLTPDALAHFDLLLVEPHRDSPGLEGVLEWTGDVVLVLAGVGEEHVVDGRYTGGRARGGVVG